MGNTLFSFPLQKTGHSRRFGRFTHGALSYQDPAPPAAQVRRDGVQPHRCAAGGQRAEAGQGWAASRQPQIGSWSAGGSQCPPRSWAVPGPAAPVLQGLPAVVAGLETLMRWQCPGQLAVCRAAEGWLGVEGSRVDPHHTMAVQWRGAVVGRGHVPCCSSLLQQLARARTVAGGKVWPTLAARRQLSWNGTLGWH